MPETDASPWALEVPNFLTVGEGGRSPIWKKKVGRDSL